MKNVEASIYHIQKWIRETEREKERERERGRERKRRESVERSESGKEMEREREREREREGGEKHHMLGKEYFLEKDNLNNVFMIKKNQILL